MGHYNILVNTILTYHSEEYSICGEFRTGLWLFGSFGWPGPAQAGGGRYDALIYHDLTVECRSGEVRAFPLRPGGLWSVVRPHEVMTTATFPGVDFLDFDSLLTDEEQLARETARQFVDNEVLPIIEQHDREATFPMKLVPMLLSWAFSARIWKDMAAPECRTWSTGW